MHRVDTKSMWFCDGTAEGQNNNPKRENPLVINGEYEHANGENTLNKFTLFE